MPKIQSNDFNPQIIDFQDTKYKTDKIYKEGDVFWTMRGSVEKDKIKWEAVPFAVKEYKEKPTKHYLLAGGGALAPSAIGRMYFFTRDEAVKDFLKTHDSFEKTVSEQDKAYIKKISSNHDDLSKLDIVINQTYNAGVYIDDLCNLMNITSNLKWKIVNEYTKHLTLNDIYLQIMKHYSKTTGHLYMPTITVIVKGGFNSIVYQCNNKEIGVWEEIGKLY